ncbi:MAG TPA: lipoate--protein ligase [Chloroflexi bacterium]|nr:lipoate--protein ligase [Chloroflexota bacterium]
MLFVENEPNKDPRVNLAIEEYLIRNVAPRDEILMFYINQPSIIIGRNQITVQEINVDYVEAHDIIVVRRLSGGGAVYHDLGNLNFSFIAPNSPDNFHNFQKFTQPVVDVLRNMGVPAELSGRNDVLVEGKKISGNAQYVSGPRMASHGTLLWNTDLSRVGAALKVKPAKFESKGIQSVRSRVANITEYLPENPPDIMQFRQMIIDGVFGGGHVNEYKLTESDWEGIHKISEERYQSWDWNYGKSPAFAINRETRYGGGTIEAWLDVGKGGVIENIRFFGDFFGQRDVAELESSLQGCLYEPKGLRECLRDVEISNYFVNFSLEELIQLLY